MDNPPVPPEPTDSQVTLPRNIIKRPWSVTLLVLGVLILTGLNLTRFGLSLIDWSFLASQPGVSPYYLAITGFIWTVAGSFLVWGLWRPKAWAPTLMQAEALTYVLYYWLDLLFLKDHTVSGAASILRATIPTNWLFSASITVIYLTFMQWALSRSNVKIYFTRVDPGIRPDPVKDNLEHES
jgi:hypothetical protein